MRKDKKTQNSASRKDTFYQRAKEQGKYIYLSIHYFFYIFLEHYYSLFNSLLFLRWEFR